MNLTNLQVIPCGIGYDSPHLDAEFAKRLAVTLEIFDSVLKLDAPGL